MDTKNTLIETLNSNQGLFEDINKNVFFARNIVGILRNIESVIPEDCRENFYTNLKTLRLNFDSMDMLDKGYAGSYDSKSNTIRMDNYMLVSAGKGMYPNGINFDEETLMILYHELLHMSSCSRDDSFNTAGFRNIVKDANGEVLYEDLFCGMDEGFTELLATLAFGKQPQDTTSSYEPQIHIMKSLASIVGFENIKRAYFDNRKGMESITNILKELDNNFDPDAFYSRIEHCFSYPEGDELFDPYILKHLQYELSYLSDRKKQQQTRNEKSNSRKHSPDNIEI